MPDTPSCELHCPGDTRGLVLASSSPRRRDLLDSLGLRFEIDASDGDEAITPGAEIATVVTELAIAKAREVASRHPASLIIAADTLVVHAGNVFAKPRDEADAREMLLSLSNDSHRVYSGLVVLDAATMAYESQVVETEVRLRELSLPEIDAYLRTPEPYDKAGAYGMQGLGAVFVERIVGDASNVVGLPLGALNELLRRFGACVICRQRP